MKPVKYLIMMLMLEFAFCILSVGCGNPAPKPLSPEDTLFSAFPNPSPDPIPRTPVIQISPQELVNQAVTDAEKIHGVNRAYAFVADKIIYIGLDISESNNHSQSTVMEKEARNRIEGMRSGYTVRVTSDGNTVKLIKTVNQGLAQGQAFSDFNNEVHRVVVKMTPKGSRLLNWPVNLFYIIGVHSGFIHALSSSGYYWFK